MPSLATELRWAYADNVDDLASLTDAELDEALQHAAALEYQLVAERERRRADDE